MQGVNLCDNLSLFLSLSLSLSPTRIRSSDCPIHAPAFYFSKVSSLKNKWETIIFIYAVTQLCLYKFLSCLANWFKEKEDDGIPVLLISFTKVKLLPTVWLSFWYLKIRSSIQRFVKGWKTKIRANFYAEVERCSCKKGSGLKKP